MPALVAGALFYTARNPSGPLDNCPGTGDSAPGTLAYGLDPEKNRTDPPVTYEPMTLDRLTSAKVSASDLSPLQGAQVSGYLTDARLSGPESAQCHLSDPRAEDYHVYIGPEPSSPKSACIVVELTGRLPRPSLESLQSLKGKKVTVKGWIFCDKEHEASSVADRPGKSDWRASCWEVHPVTSLEAQ